MMVFKFGGGILYDAEAIRKLPGILGLFPREDMVIVISAFGKTTNNLEELVHARYDNSNPDEILKKIRKYHDEILHGLFHNEKSDVFRNTDDLFRNIENSLTALPSGNFDLDYDRIIFYGELISSKIVHHFLTETGIMNEWLDARGLIRTDSTFREAQVDFAKSFDLVSGRISDHHDKTKNTRKIYVTQGFIGANESGQTTSLGREGSDYTAAILANLLDAKSVIIWKDVPGILNADPKHFPDAIRLSRISYAEATELAYYGAKVLHYKTIKPLQNKEIPLEIRSYFDPGITGTLISKDTTLDTKIPSIILKPDQVLISVSSRDLSFISEDIFHDVFGLLTEAGMHMNIIQNSALTLSVCVDRHRNLQQLLNKLHDHYHVRYNEGLELLTIRHHTPEVVSRFSSHCEVLLEQQNRSVVQLVLR